MGKSEERKSKKSKEKTPKSKKPKADKKVEEAAEKKAKKEQEEKLRELKRLAAAVQASKDVWAKKEQTRREKLVHLKKMVVERKEQKANKKAENKQLTGKGSGNQSSDQNLQLTGGIMKGLWWALRVEKRYTDDKYHYAMNVRMSPTSWMDYKFPKNPQSWESGELPQQRKHQWLNANPPWKTVQWKEIVNTERYRYGPLGYCEDNDYHYVEQPRSRKIYKYTCVKEDEDHWKPKRIEYRFPKKPGELPGWRKNYFEESLARAVKRDDDFETIQWHKVVPREMRSRYFRYIYPRR